MTDLWVSKVYLFKATNILNHYVNNYLSYFNLIIILSQFRAGDELSIHDHELILLKDPMVEDDFDDNFHMLNSYNQNISPISRSLSESDISELCVTATGDAHIGGGVANGCTPPHILHGSLPPSDDEIHHLLQYDDDEIHQLHHHNFNNNRRALLHPGTNHKVVDVLPIAEENKSNGRAPLHIRDTSGDDRYDDEHEHHYRATRNSLPPPPILPPKKGNRGEQNSNAHTASTPSAYHPHNQNQNHDITTLPYNNDYQQRTINEHLNSQHANARLLNQKSGVTSTQQHRYSKEMKSISSAGTKGATKQQQQEQQHQSNYHSNHHSNFEQNFHAVGSNSGGSSSSGSSERRHRNHNKA